ncbi:MAG: PIN domain-containing protein [Thermofilum sp.]|uniref:Uncharacterized protein n=2 Tax=Thermofilaceae TaxID=114378 RepID=S5ZX84_9CREN|nr:PIN domain-containing protein [Thermofilum adornatum]AGT35934.1 hypothetical protein N186_07980 [Thermofilum adornatum]
MSSACYLDANIIIALLFPTDAHHKNSLERVYHLNMQGTRLVTSTYALVEVTRNTLHTLSQLEQGKYIFAEPLPQYIRLLQNLNPNQRCEALLNYIISYIKNGFHIEVIEQEYLYEIETTNNTKIAKLFHEAIKLSWINIRTKDLLHIAIANLLKTHGVKCIITADKTDFEPIKQTLEKDLDLEVEILTTQQS